MTEFQLVSIGPGSEREGKVLFSSSLPADLQRGLATTARRLNRGKALVVRVAVHRLFELDRAELEYHLSAYYKAGPKGPPRPFTTNLTLSLKEKMTLFATQLQRNKADLLRASLFDFFLLSPREQAREMRRYLSG